MAPLSTGQRPLARALQVRRGAPPSASVVVLPQQSPGGSEVLVQVHAAALTATDALLCSGIIPPALSEIFPSSATLIPGFFFYGEVLSTGQFVRDLNAGEPVLGVIDGTAFASGGSSASDSGASVANKSPLSSPGGTGQDAEEGGGCFREAVRVHFSSLLPVAELVAAHLHMPSVVAHLPPMVNALFCLSSHLQLRGGQALLLIVPRLGEIIFLLQRLLLISDAWSGPLFLIVQFGLAPTRADLERQPLLRPLLLRDMPPADLENDSPDLRPAGSFLDDFTGFSVEEHVQQKTPGAAQPDQSTESLKELVRQVHGLTGGVGIDVVMACDVDLTPPDPAVQQEPLDAVGNGASAENCISARGPGIPLEPQHRPSTLLRTLLGALALRGRLVTNSRKVEMMPADGEHLWIKEGSLSLWNPHCLLLSGSRQGALLHALAEVAARIARAELPVVESEVAQYRLFEQFHHALEASAGRGSKPSVGALSPQIAIVVV